MAPATPHSTYSPHRRGRHFGRRGLLGITAAVAAGTVSTVSGCRSTAGSSTPAPTFVLVHGSASNGNFWTPVVRELALRGRASVPLDLPGHGTKSTLRRSYQAPQDLQDFASSPSGVDGLTMDDYAEHVGAAVEKAAEHGPVVLVGHSLGGSSVTRVANETPSLLAGITYVSAFCCTELESPLAYLGTEDARDGAAAPSAPSLSDEDLGQVPDGTTRYNWRTSDRAFLDATREQLMADATEEQFLATIATVQQPDESIQASLDNAQITPDTWGAVPRTYIRLTADRIVTPALQDRMIAEADRAAPQNRFTITDIDSSHLGVMHQAPSLAAALMDSWS
ncbi:alpha/beta hydrolase [Brachybacterium sp. FME24]|uniref:alpha/beta hydrolase n=1 Tax=Brachybacterium sp. FME24 TaxID=2742605 RepID=UPI0018668BBA|nr:alpha/beta hydrolase [Brachybacterium sp. FME24]